MDNRRIHDGIVGLVIFIFVALGYYGNPLWLLVPAVLGLVLIQSAFSGFCPLYFILNKLQPGK